MRKRRKSAGLRGKIALRFLISCVFETCQVGAVIPGGDRLSEGFSGAVGGCRERLTHWTSTPSTTFTLASSTPSVFSVDFFNLNLTRYWINSNSQKLRQWLSWTLNYSWVWDKALKLEKFIYFPLFSGPVKNETICSKNTVDIFMSIFTSLKYTVIQQLSYITRSVYKCCISNDYYHICTSVWAAATAVLLWNHK